MNKQYIYTCNMLTVALLIITFILSMSIDNKRIHKFVYNLRNGCIGLTLFYNVLLLIIDCIMFLREVF